MHDFDSVEPSADELAAIEAEEPLIAVELDWLAAELALLDAVDERGAPSQIDWQRVRSAERRVIAETLNYVSRRTRWGSPRRAA